MNRNDSDIEFRKMIDTLEARIFEFAEHGYSKEQILEYLRKIGELSRVDSDTTDLISKNMDILSRVVDVAIFSIKKPNIQFEIRGLYRDIFELADHGSSKAQILEYLRAIGGLSQESKNLISKNMDLLIRVIDVALFRVEKTTIYPEVKRLYQQMVDENNLAYIGKDGKNYYSREALERANQDYMNQMYNVK